MTTFATITDAIEYVETVLGEYASDFDSEAIAREITDWVDGELTLTLDESDESDERFWEIVAKYDISE